MTTMFHLDNPVVNFAISDGGKRGIEIMRQSFDAHSSDPPDVLCVGWGRFMPNSGSAFENLAVSFYGRSQRLEIADAIQDVSGLPVVFFATPKDYTKFAGKVLDFADDRGFFLRTP